MYRFPNARDGIARLLDGTLTSDGRAITAYVNLEVDFAQHLPAVHVMREGGAVNGVQRTDRVGVHVYDQGNKASDVAEEICAALADRDHDAPGVGLLDRVTVASVPTDVPYYSDTISQCVASYDVVTRPLPD